MHDAMHEIKFALYCIKPADLYMATVSTLLDTRQKLKDDTYRIRLQVYHQRKQFLADTPFTATKDDWDALKASKLSTTALKTLKKQLAQEVNKANGILATLKIITPLTFRKLYYAEAGIYRSTISTHIKDLYNHYIKNLEADDKFKTAMNYKNAIVSFQLYGTEELGFGSYKKPKDGIALEAITPQFLKSYEKWMLDRDRSISTVRSYFRTLRSIFNEAISNNLISSNAYPFGGRKYAVGSSTAAKKNLIEKEMLEFWRYQPGPESQKAKDFWWFCYFCNGANPVDVLNLKWTDVHGDEIIFTRKKTQFSKTENRYIRAQVTPEMKKIMKQYAGKIYVFNVLAAGMSEKEKYTTATTFSRTINRSLERMCKHMKLRSRLTLSQARSTYATVMKMAGTSTSIIAEQMGHANEKTTQDYLGSLSSTQVKELSTLLISFRDKKSKRK